MDFTFNYTLEKKDLINFELFKLKTSKFLNMVYITVLIVLVMNTYYAVSEKKLCIFAYCGILYYRRGGVFILCYKNQA